MGERDSVKRFSTLFDKNKSSMNPNEQTKTVSRKLSFHEGNVYPHSQDYADTKMTTLGKFLRPHTDF